MTSVAARWGWAALVVAGLPLTVIAARAEDPAASTHVGEGIAGTPPDAAPGLIDKLVDPANGGVAGTGLGKMSTAKKSGAGTGMSVKGPPGTGVDPDAPKPSP